MVATAEQRNHAMSFLKKAEEYLASAEDNLAGDRHAPAISATYRVATTIRTPGCRQSPPWLAVELVVADLLAPLRSGCRSAGASQMARCTMKLSGEAPCQRSTFATTTPAESSSTTPQSATST
jgi:hypothetical protein